MVDVFKVAQLTVPDAIASLPRRVGPNPPGRTESDFLDAASKPANRAPPKTEAFKQSYQGLDVAASIGLVCPIIRRFIAPLLGRIATGPGNAIVAERRRACDSVVGVSEARAKVTQRTCPDRSVGPP